MIYNFKYGAGGVFFNNFPRYFIKIYKSDARSFPF